MSTQNIEEIVRGIIDNLSDGVSELVLMVVVLAEQNAPMPAHLPNASSQINSTAEKLAKIAKQLAKQDYAQFPSIANEITEAATAVESATSTLAGAINALQSGGDRKRGWDGLVDACRVMSGKTIRLLHIIYGAPLQRLLLNADNLNDAIDRFDAKPKGINSPNEDQRKQAQQDVLDKLKPITDAALRMQKHLNDRAKNADNPHTRGQLEKAAQDVRDKAQAMVDAVNAGFNDPSKADFTKPLQDLRDAVDDGRDVAKRTAPPAPQSLQNASPKNLDEAIERAKAAARDIPPSVKNNHHGPANDKLKDSVAEVRKRIEPNPAKPYDWNKEVEAPMAEQYRAAREALRNPGNPTAKQNLDKATDDLVRALDDLKPERRGGAGGPREGFAPLRQDYDPATSSGAPGSGPGGRGGPGSGAGGRGGQGNDPYSNAPNAPGYGSGAGGRPGQGNDPYSNAPNAPGYGSGAGGRPGQGNDPYSNAPNAPGAGGRGGPNAPYGGNKGGAPGADDDAGFKRRADPSGGHGGPGSGAGGPSGGYGNKGGPTAPPGGSKAPGQYPSGGSPYGKHPTEEQKKTLADKARKIAEPLTQAINKPEDREKEAYDRLKDALNNARNDADRKDPRATQARAKQAADAAKDLAKQFRERANNPDNGLNDDERDGRRKAADDLDKITPEFLDKTKDAVKDLNNDPVVNDWKDAARKLERAADRGLDDPHRDKPLTQKDFDKLKGHLEKAAAAAKRGDYKAKQKELDAAKPLIERARNFTIRKGRGIPDPDKPDGPSDELMNLWKKFLGARDPDHMQKLIDDLENAYKKLDKDTGSSPVAAANAVEKAIDHVQGAVDSGDPRRLAPAAKALQDKYNDFINEINNSPDPQVKAAGNKAANALRPQVEEMIKKAADAMQNPHDRNKQAAVNHMVPQMKKPLAEFKKDIRPQQDDILQNESHGAGVKDAQAKLREALLAGNPDKVKKAVDDLKKALGTYNDHARGVVKATPPEKKPYMDDKLVDLEDAQRNLDNVDKSTPLAAIERMADRIPTAVDEFEDGMHSSPADDTIKAAAKANNLNAFMSGVDDSEMDLGDLLNAAGELSDLMRGMVGNTASVAQDLSCSEQPLTEAARNALELGGILAQMNNVGWNQPASNVSEQIRGKMDAVRGPGSSSNPFERAPAITLDKARSFEDIAQAVAYNIHQQNKEMNFQSKTGENVAIELANLASAARGGDKQKLLLSAKAASSQIQAYAKELTELANKIPGKTPRERELQEHLLRCAQGLKNYSMHLKILSSVKAASIEQSRDTDESLSTIARDLGDIITQSLGSMRTVYTTILR